MPEAPIPSKFQQQPEPNEVVISTALDPNMRVIKNYQQKEQTAKVGTQKCPKCQCEIPLAEWNQHMKLELMNPKFAEEKRKREQRAQLNSLATGDEIATNLKKFA